MGTSGGVVMGARKQSRTSWVVASVALGTASSRRCWAGLEVR